MSRFDGVPVPQPRPSALPGAFPLPPPVPVPDAVSPGNVLIPSGAGTETIKALMARRQALAERQPAFAQGAANIPQGLAQLADIFVNSMGERSAARQESEGRAQLAKIMAGIGDTGPSSEQIAQAYQYDPDLALALYKQRADAQAAAAKEETYGPIITGPEAEKLGLDPTKQYQQNLRTNQWDPVGGSGSSITINPPSAETGAKLGLAQGFLDNYDAILKSVDAGEMTGGGYITSVQLGRGNGGAMYRNLLQGTEALVRILTGAGMSEGEARSRVTQFEPTITDDAPTLRSKVQGLKQALDNVIEGVKTRGATPDKTEPDAASTPPAPDASTPPAPAPAPDASTPPAPDLPMVEEGPGEGTPSKHPDGTEADGSDGKEYIVKGGVWTLKKR